ncbi:MAG: HlyC/CorC family transporter [Chrysiogenetes bacterium]|nr:HlyC/CorC family transporter [Chrysiogenetes bacterium]
MDDDPDQLISTLFTILGLVLANGVFVAAELGFSGLQRFRVQEMIDAGNRRARRLLKLLDKAEKYSATTQVGISLATVMLGWVSVEALAGAFMGYPGGFSYAIAIALSLTVLVTLHFVLGEQVPKIVALASPERVSLWLYWPVHLMAVALTPLLALLNAGVDALAGSLGQESPVLAGHRMVQSEEELKHLVGASKRHGVLEASEEELIHSVLEFTDRTAEEIMCPRTDMEAVREDVTMDALLKLMADSEYSRYPVYRETDDHIIGTIHVKDMIERLADSDDGPFRVTDLMRPPTFVREEMRLPDLLAALRRDKAHMAIVVSEFGDVSGLVTMEDVLEELVGEISDEFDEPETPFEERSGGRYSIDGMVTIEEVNERLGLNLPDEDYTSIGGYVFGRIGRRPKVGDKAEIEGATLRVEAIDGLRVSRVLYLPEGSEQKISDKAAAN